VSNSAACCQAVIWATKSALGAVRGCCLLPGHSPRSWPSTPAACTQDFSADVALTNLPFAPPRFPVAAAAFRSEMAPLTPLKSDTEPAVFATSSTQEPLQVGR
jgi:hypothetical protein